jgi:hypothetical protein
MAISSTVFNLDTKNILSMERCIIDENNSIRKKDFFKSFHSLLEQSTKKKVER